MAKNEGKSMNACIDLSYVILWQSINWIRVFNGTLDKHKILNSCSIEKFSMIMYKIEYDDLFY